MSTAPSFLTESRSVTAQSAPALPAPRALLLDFGGVVFSTTARMTWARDLATQLAARGHALGAELDVAQVEASLRAGRTALSLWLWFWSR